MPKARKWVPVGKVLREWGIRGELKCECFNLKSSIFTQVEKFYREESGTYLELGVEKVKPHGKYWLIKFRDYDSPESARALRGSLLALPRDQLPKPEAGEIYLSDLIGLKVRGPQGEDLGAIQNMIRIGDSETMMIGKDPKDTVEIPYEREFVASTQLEKGQVVLKKMALEIFEMNRPRDHDKTL